MPTADHCIALLMRQCRVHDCAAVHGVNLLSSVGECLRHPKEVLHWGSHSHRPFPHPPASPISLKHLGRLSRTFLSPHLRFTSSKCTFLTSYSTTLTRTSTDAVDISIHPSLVERYYPQLLHHRCFPFTHSSVPVGRELRRLLLRRRGADMKVQEHVSGNF